MKASLRVGLLAVLIAIAITRIQCKSIQDAALVAADTSENLNEILDHIEEEEEQEEGPVDSEEDERVEAIETGTFKPDEFKEAERSEAIESGTFKPKNTKSKSTDEDDSWLPPKAAITDQIFTINEKDHAKNLIDGDIAVPEKTKENEENNEKNEKRNALRDKADIWRSRVIPYILHSSLDASALSAITAAIADIEANTCVRFKKEQSPPSEHYVRLFKGGGCYSYVGKTGGASQDLSLGNGCGHKGIAIHEFMHALGFYHEQSRYDRDQYISIDFSNIMSGKENNFNKYTIEKVTGLGLPYDYDGIMHYGAYAFAKDRSKPVIVKLKSTGGPIGQRNGMSTTDKQQINTLYDCATDSVANSWSSWSSWSSCLTTTSGSRQELGQRFCFRDDLSACPGARSDGTEWRSRACGSGPVTSAPATPGPGTTQSKQTTASPVTVPGGSGSINQPICGTRSTALGHPGLEPQNIVGGSVVQPGDWPWQVGFTTKGSTFIFCGGTLVSDEWIVTAAHCFVRSASTPTKYTARLGEHDKNTNEGREQVIILEKIHLHPNYNSRTLDNDIALVKLSQKATFSKYIRPACVPDSATVLLPNQNTFVSGWGRTAEGGSTSSTLRVAQVPIVSYSKCRASYGASRITPAMICAGLDKGGVDSCQGDSGGPLVYKKTSDSKFYVAGVVSWGIGCARPDKYGVYANVSFLRSWMDSVIPSTVGPTVPGPTGISALSCTFEKDLCKWKQATNDQFDWTRRTGSTPSSSTGPSSSATGAKGFYMYIETSSPRTNGDSAELVTSTLSTSTPSCLSFKANMFGSTIGSLSVATIKGASRTVLYTKTGNQGQAWFDVKIDVPAATSFQIVIKAVRGTSYTGDIAIDEVTATSGTCAGGVKPTVQPTFPPIGPMTCDFESNICKWKQATDDKFDWTLRKGATPSSSTGPSQSATGAAGQYAYIETSYPRRAGDNAILVSPLMATAHPTCLTFKANMFGSNIDTLRVTIVKGANRRVLYTKTGDQGKSWFDVVVNIPTECLFKIEISAIRGASYRGDIAIDEIKNYLTRCTPGPVGPVATPSPTPPPALMKCDFETDICNWTQATNDEFNWTRRKGATPSSGTGPSQSATGAAGHYIFIETSYPRKEHDVAKIVSPVMSRNIPTCLKFKANMNGATIGTLTVTKVKGGSNSVLYTKSENQGSAWFDVQVDIPVDSSFKIEISGRRASSWSGDIAIDEITELSRKCSGPAPTPSPGPTSAPTPSPGPTSAPKGCGVSTFPQLRVIGGKDVTRGSWPWQILMLRGGTPICGGTLINQNTVVTAAHCVSGRENSPSSFKVRVGEHDRRKTEGSEVDIQVSKIESHPDYSRSTIDYDIAVMKLATKAPLGPYVATACLPNAGEAPPTNSTCYITGFGKIKHPGTMYHTLQQAAIKVRSQAECSRVNNILPITARMICAGNGPNVPQSGCHGDSGGPFVCEKGGKWYLQGAVSWGDSTCSSRRFTVFAKTTDTEINAWIKARA